MPRIHRPPTFETIRLAYYGCTNRPFFHVILTKNTWDRNATPLENLGTYDPMPNIYNEKLVSLDVERIKYHLSNNVEVSKRVSILFGLAGILPVHPMSYIDAKRNRKKIELKKLKAESETSTENSDD